MRGCGWKIGQIVGAACPRLGTAFAPVQFLEPDASRPTCSVNCLLNRSHTLVRCRPPAGANGPHSIKWGKSPMDHRLEAGATFVQQAVKRNSTGRSPPVC